MALGSASVWVRKRKTIDALYGGKGRERLVLAVFPCVIKKEKIYNDSPAIKRRKHTPEGKVAGSQRGRGKFKRCRKREWEEEQRRRGKKHRKR